MIFGSKHYTPNFFFKKNRSTDAHANIDKEKKIDANVNTHQTAFVNAIRNLMNGIRSQGFSI